MKLFRKVRKRIVANRASKNYIKACKMAERRYEETSHTPHYVVSELDNECSLMVVNKESFLAMRKDSILAMRKKRLKRNELTLSMLRRGCWYHTRNKRGADRMDARDVIKRKMTYVHMCLESYGLLDSQQE